MLDGNERLRKSTARSSYHGKFQPRGEGLENRLLMAIDLGGTTPTLNPNIATAPNGMDFAGAQIGQGAGFSVADVGNVVSSSPYDDFVIGAPTVGSTPATIGTGINSAAYLIFGSQTVGLTTVTDWIGKNAAGNFNYSPTDRVGDLGQMTNPPNANVDIQTNPINGDQLDFPFPAIKFVNTVNLVSKLGVSVAGVRLPSGAGAILFGAPAHSTATS